LGKGGAKFSPASIPVDFTRQSQSAFDKAYMNAPFDVGYNEAHSLAA
jgi:hypothetical protein